MLYRLEKYQLVQPGDGRSYNFEFSSENNSKLSKRHIVISRLANHENHAYLEAKASFINNQTIRQGSGKSVIVMSGQAPLGHFILRMERAVCQITPV